MNFYQKHVFFCVNRRDNGKQCCEDEHASKMRDYAKKRIRELGLQGEGRIRINAAGCMDRCALGPVLVIYPEGIWYTYHSREDIDRIIEEHLVKGQIVSSLLLQG